MLALTIHLLQPMQVAASATIEPIFVHTSEKLGLQAHVIEGVDRLIVVGLDLSCKATLAIQTTAPRYKRDPGCEYQDGCRNPLRATCDVADDNSANEGRKSYPQGRPRVLGS